MHLIPIDFHGDMIFAADRDGVILVAVKPICRSLGLEWSGQFRRIHRDRILRECIVKMAIPSPSGGDQEMILLPLSLLNGWFFGIHENQVKDPAAREKIVLYKRECYQALFAHFAEKAGHPELAGQTMAARELMPGEPGFVEAVTLFRQVRLAKGSVAAMQLYRKLGLPLVPAMDEPVARFDGQAHDGIGLFAAEMVELVKGSSETARTLYNAYLAWCADRGELAVSEYAFSKALRQHFRRTDERVRRYLNCRLRAAPMDGAHEQEGAAAN